MKAPEIKDLISFIANSGLQEVNVETVEIKLHVKRNSVAGAPSGGLFPSEIPMVTPAPTTPAPLPVAPAPVEVAPAPVAAPAPVVEEAPAAAPVADDSNYVTIKSPMIGTFYESPNPDAGAFVKVGDTIKAGQVICIVEAMKLFNEIESEVSGKVVKILVDNSSPIEYDQPLFLVDPS